MTREEIAQYIKSELANENIYHSVEIYLGADDYKVILKALEQEPSYSEKLNKSEIPTGSTTKNDLAVDMPREKAIEILKDWDGYFIGHSSDDVNEALNIAIRALERPEKNVVAVVPSGDTISRQAVIDCLTNTAKYYEREDADEWTKGIHYGLLHGVDNILDNVPTVEAIPKDQYEARLKADMVAMLTELQIEIEELEPMYMDMIFPRQVNEVIQKKINALKENKDE